MARFAGLCVAVHTDMGTITYMTEVAYPPFAYLMTVDSTPELSIGEITDWAKAEWHETRDVTLDLLVAFGHTPYPGDYRSRAAIDAEIAKNKAALDSAADAGFLSGSDCVRKLIQKMVPTPQPLLTCPGLQYWRPYVGTPYLLPCRRIVPWVLRV